MGYTEYDKVCNLTERREDHIMLRNLKTGMIGHTLGCTYEGNTVQVRLDDGSLDSWGREDISMITPETGRIMTRIREMELCAGSMD